MFAANRSCLARHDVVPGLIRPGLTLLAGEGGQGRDAPARRPLPDLPLLHDVNSLPDSADVRAWIARALRQ